MRALTSRVTGRARRNSKRPMNARDMTEQLVERARRSNQRVPAKAA